MIILHLALGGCLKAPPTDFGITADTGGHIAYVLDAAAHQARLPDVDRVIIATRLFEDARLGSAYAQPEETVAPGLTIARIATGDRRYLEKEALGADLPAFTAAFLEHLAGMPRRPDVIHAHFADAAAVAMAAQRRFGIPFVYTPHALGIDKRAQRIACAGLETRIAAEGAAIAAAAAIVVSTREEATEQLGGYGVALGARVHAIAPGVPRRDLLPTRPTLADRLGEWLDRPERPIILAVARPVAKKNLAALVRAYAGDATLRGTANLVILAGRHDHASEDERTVLDELHILAADPGLKGRIALPPQHDADDVAALYARAARGGIFVNPALHEPFGLTLIEAAAAGVPVVATRNGGPAEIVETLGHGLVVDPRDTGAIAAAIRAIVGDPARHAHCAAAGMRGADRYCWHRYAAATRTLYGRLATPKLLASDIDNTLTGCLPAAAEFARWRQRASLPFVVATGRSFDAARMILRRWRLPSPDAFIVDVGTRIMLPHGIGGWRACDDYARRLDENWDRPAVIDALAPLGLAAQPAATAGPHKISFYGSAADASRIRAALDAAKLQARIVFSHDQLIDVLAPGGGKASAIAAYAALHGWTLADCVAAGDSGNDADMLAACGHAIVVGNASGELAQLPVRPGLHRVAAHHAAGVLEGLALLGLAPVDAAAVAA
ncbi:sucrose-phosphate synthase [Sphingomonas metalli]|uniref:sucrose-phosphate synthase n=1 Tax=Sphingomonas metalli TaxID=1779358 RepID=A0A916TF43_9SPHN|nr:HAD family hydrolase [Sphingomonas metalli]GGB40904.1 sucrose-phosphate synthase [Sphingomonas metalli]